jgi:hypothetical protein
MVSPGSAASTADWMVRKVPAVLAVAALVVAGVLVHDQDASM